MAKAHKCPLAAMCMGVHKKEWRKVAIGSFDSPRPQRDCRKKLSNDRNGRWKLVVGVVEVSSLLLLPKVTIVGKSVWMVYLLDSVLGWLLRHGYTHCTLCPLPSYTVIQLQNRALFPPFAICHSEVNEVYSLYNTYSHAHIVAHMYIKNSQATFTTCIDRVPKWAWLQVTVTSWARHRYSDDVT